MDLIIYSNPDQVNGHSAALLGFVKTRLSEKGLAYEVIDLYADNFDPVLKQEELRGRPSDRLVLSYQEKISRASRLIFIFPVWWYTTPAILKGFIDRVFSAGFAYNFKKAPQVPEILNPVLGFLAGRKSLYGIFMS
ncbi:hypothetical protein FJZ26_04590, partial [Candidatus Parvarchaeota archaeon]|nr:hypothetical protein [Candidatus Parvarchaeota archaeon]